jgi:uncharacterized protein (DUF433 family)
MFMEPIIHSDPEIMSGTTVFVGTRVPIRTLIDYIEGDHPLSDFLDDFPTVTKPQVMAFLEAAAEQLAVRSR